MAILSDEIVLQQLILIKFDHSLQCSEDELMQRVRLIYNDCKHLSAENFVFKAAQVRKKNLYGKFPAAADFLQAEGLPEAKRPALPWTPENVSKNAQKAKFYRGNIDLFLRYFDSSAHYESLIKAGQFEKIEQIIRDGQKR